jgi:hypothetical protein
MRFSLALSVALNLLLLTGIVAARIDPARSDGLDFAPGVGAVAYEAVPVDARDGETLDELLGALEGAGLDRAEQKLLLAGWLEARYRNAHEPAGPRYWEQGYAPGRDKLAADFAVERAVRAALIELFGVGAAVDPAFDAVFRPLGPAYAFLGSEAQLSLQAWQLERLAAPPAGGAAVAGGALLCRPQGSGGADAVAQAPLPTPRFSPAEDAEYRLRFSPLAAQLRDAGIVRGETEFREIFGLVRELEQSGGPSEQAEVRQGLRSRLGDDGFDRFWSVRDPVFAGIGEYLSRRGVAPHQTRAAYSIVNRSQERLLAMLGRHGDEASLMSALQRIRQDETADLERVLGGEAAAGLQAAMNGIALRISQSSAAGC